MTRVKGDTAFSTSVDIAGKKPLDAKTLVQEKSDLINAQTWQVYSAITSKTVDSFYKGMIVSVANDTEQNNGLYRLNGSDPTVIENWEKVNAQIDIDETLSSNSDALIPSQKAVKAYVDANAGATYTAGDNIKIVGNAISVTGYATEVDALDDAKEGVIINPKTLHYVLQNITKISG